MAEPTVVSETLILTDSDGNVTKDESKATHAEVIQEMSDGTHRSTVLIRE